MKTLTKKRTKFVHGAICELAPKLLGRLRMRNISAAGQFNISMLHEFLPCSSSTPDVTHLKTQELVFIIQGKAAGFLNGRKIVLKKGDYLVIPAGTKHRFETGAQGVEALSVFTPPMDPAKPDAVVVFKRRAS